MSFRALFCLTRERLDGPPLPVDEQLRGLPELPVLRAVSHVYVHRLCLRGACVSASVRRLGEIPRGESVLFLICIMHEGRLL